jgi:hypothetical protein
MLVLGAVFAGSPDRALDMLWLSQMTCRDADAGPAGAALERIAPLLEACRKALIEYPDMPRHSTPMLVLAMAIASTEVPQSVASPIA